MTTQKQVDELAIAAGVSPRTDFSGGKHVEGDHREIDPATGMQKAYVVLTAEERAKGFVRPVRRTYVHLTCNTETRMSQDIAETYARKPDFYSGTFCANCRGHYPLSQFRWKDNLNQMVGS